MMTVDDWLKQTCAQLRTAKIATARLDALVLLEDSLGVDKGYILAHPEFQISDQKLSQLQKLLTRRAEHVPLAYLRGHNEFYGREFVVSADVLVPRPETESLIELLKELMASPELIANAPCNSRRWALADVGAGSGNIGISAALELPGVDVELLEIDDRAVAIARTNVINFATSTPVIKSDLLTNATHPYDILLCNLPYVPDSYAINTAAQHEPAKAIFGGLDGLDLFRALFSQIDKLAVRPLYILTEALPETHTQLTDLALSHGYSLIKTNDFCQLYKQTT